MVAFKPKPGEERPDRKGGFKTSGELEQPDGLNEDGQAMWNFLVEAMPKGLMQSVDAAALFGLCRHWAIWRHWERMATSEDVAIAYKASCMAGNAWKHFDALARQFGLMPKARQSIKYDEFENGTDDFSVFMGDQLSIRN